MPSLQTDILTLLRERHFLPYNFTGIRKLYVERFPRAPVPVDNDLHCALKPLRQAGRIGVERGPEGFILILTEPSHE